VGFVAGPDLELDAIDFIDRQIGAGAQGGVVLTSDTVTYPSGLEDSDAPDEMVPFVTVSLTAAGATIAAAVLLARGGFGARYPWEPEYEGDEAPEVGYEVANCRIALDEPSPAVSSEAPGLDLPLDIIAAAEPVPAADSVGDPCIEWVVTITGREDGRPVFGRPALSIRVRVGPRGNVELAGEVDGSEPPAIVADEGPHGVYVFLQGPPASWDEVSAPWPAPT
jgi:hypothetical protein